METRVNALKEVKPALEKVYGAFGEKQRETANEVRRHRKLNGLSKKMCPLSA